VARLPTDLKRGFVRELADAVADGEAPSLAQALKNLRRGQFQFVGTGEIVVSRSGDGFSGTFAIPSNVGGGLTQSGVFELAQELTDLYDRALAFLTKVARYGLDADTVDADGWPSPLPAEVDASPSIADSATATRMLVYLVPRTQRMSDFSQFEVGGVVA
jgi:hypothetical protein